MSVNTTDRKPAILPDFLFTKDGLLKRFPQLQPSNLKINQKGKLNRSHYVLNYPLGFLALSTRRFAMFSAISHSLCGLYCTQEKWGTLSK